MAGTQRMKGRLTGADNDGFTMKVGFRRVVRVAYADVTSIRTRGVSAGTVALIAMGGGVGLLLLSGLYLG